MKTTQKVWNWLLAAQEPILLHSPSSLVLLSHCAVRVNGYDKNTYSLARSLCIEFPHPFHQQHHGSLWCLAAWNKQAPFERGMSVAPQVKSLTHCTNEWSNETEIFQIQKWINGFRLVLGADGTMAAVFSNALPFSPVHVMPLQCNTQCTAVIMDLN